MRRQFPFFNSKNVLSPSNVNKITATAPSIEEINYKTGMTMAERNDVIKERETRLKKMNKNNIAKSKIEKIKFNNPINSTNFIQIILIVSNIRILFVVC